MKKITHDAKEAFLEGRFFDKDNTRVELSDNRLRGNLFVRDVLVASINYENGRIAFSLGHKPSASILERLKCAGVHLFKDNKKYWYNDKEIELGRIYVIHEGKIIDENGGEL